MTKSKDILDFAHTILVMRASALAGAELIEAGALGGPSAAVYEYKRLAAAGPGEPELSQHEVRTADGSIGLSFERGRGVIRVVLQLKGFSTLSAFAGHAGRLVGSNGSIDYAFRFDDKGRAVCTLADEVRIIEGLADLRIVVDINP